MDEFVVIKVAHIVSSLNIGGAERFVIDLCEVQKNEGMQPYMISLGKPSEDLEHVCQQLKIQVFSFNNSLSLKLLKVLSKLRRCDVVHIHSQHALKFIYRILPVLNTKCIYTRHGAAPLAAEYWLKMHKKSARYVDAITFVSQEGFENFQKTHGWKNIPSSVIDNGVLIKPIEKAKPDHSILRIGSVGRMIPLKSQITLLQAASLLPLKVQENLEIHYFGDGECLPILQAYDEQQHWPVKVFFHGMVNDRDKIYSSFDVLAVTSETEGLSMVIIEAMANRIPVVATNVGGNPKLVIEGETGHLFDYSDDQKLASLISGFAQDTQTINTLGNGAFSYIKDNFSLETSAKKYAELYEK